ncbi:FUSC family protein [Streptomyces triticiradicis]|uniref:FUSC family protein n=1 Tax=Streptomyces triticiradicis TaxID=2651189 RepID=A0A7J5DPV5_9ACTN|nr:FUSC family protein [Streptomyces triticiradicis]KAB1990735.1 FUSC family protein [Streptomyces triticiradicis]
MPKRPPSPGRVRAARQSVRVTVASATGFYSALYALDRPVVAVYALFTPIALGILSPVPGGGRDRARTVLFALPVAVALTALGTALAVTTGSAVAGMLVIGFTVSFASAYGPAAASVVPGLLLFYVLACFPPYAPDTLPQRLGGLLAGGVLLVLCELLLLPAPPVQPYRARIAAALDLASSAALASAQGHRHAPERARRLREAGLALRLSQAPPASRPTGAGRTDRGLAQAGAATRRVLDQLARTAERPDSATAADPPSEALLRGVAAGCAATAGALRGARAVPGPEALEEMVAGFVAVRGRPSGTGPDADAKASLRLLECRSDLLVTAASALTAQAAVAVAIGGRRDSAGLPPEQFWYAGPSAARLLTLRLTGNLTLRSVLFQNAVRTALGLGAARLVAGALELSHGFWVLLAVLTLGRTTAGATWSTVRSAAVGTLVGALAAGALIFGAGDTVEVYAAVLVPVMFVAFSVGPIAGPAWAQGLFTLVVATAFSQLAPADWRLAETRLLDVLAGCTIGLVCGVLAWPAGAHAEVRRGVAEVLRAAAPLVRATASAVVHASGDARPRRGAAEEALRLTRHRLRIAEGAYAQYRTEGGRDPVAGGPDWHLALNCASHAVIGSHWLPRQAYGPAPPEAVRWARESAARLAAAMDDAAAFPPGGVLAAPVPLPHEVVSAAPAPVLPALVDVDTWLRTLAAELTAIGGSGPEEPPPPVRDGGARPATSRDTAARTGG